MASRKPKQQGAAKPPDDQPSDDPKELRKGAEQQRRHQAQALRKHPLPMDAEPAFAFKP